LHRAPSSISRELRRNGWRAPEPGAKKGPLWPQVERMLRARHSPEQIAGILRDMNSDTPTLRVSHETIYTALYALPRGQLRADLIACLRQARKSRRPRARGKDRRGGIPNMSSTLAKI
jgi:transposase, IS30 family